MHAVVLNLYRDPSRVRDVAAWLSTTHRRVTITRDPREALALAVSGRVSQVVLTGSEMDPTARRDLLAFTKCRVPVLALCYAMQCICAATGGRTERVADAPRRTRHVVRGKAVLSRHEFGVTLPPPGATDVVWYKRAGRRVVAECRYGNVTMLQYHPEASPVRRQAGGGGGEAATLDLQDLTRQHCDGADWFGIPRPRQVREIARVCPGVTAVLLDHASEDDPGWFSAMPAAVRATLRAAGMRELPRGGLTVVKSWLTEDRRLPEPRAYPRAKDVNGGMHRRGTGAIHVYRREGALKVAVHEMIHWLGLEETVREPQDVPGCVSGYRSPREAWVEATAIRVIHRGDAAAMRREAAHALDRCAAILVNAGYRRASDFLKTPEVCSRLHRQDTDIHAYFFLRAALLSLPPNARHAAPDSLERAAGHMRSPRFVAELQRRMDATPRGRSLAMTTLG